ncbi:MAG: TRZ/ATZ family hydrolase, partial [Gammaproteobacteria bacterium]|nr:TRZ/ATZ family hydrolase [Gammaproteobacteria bacterium]
MDEVDLIIHPEWIIPVEPANTVLEHYSLAIHQGQILAIAPQTEVSQTYTAAVEHRLPGQVVMPGFINAHTHAAMTLLRGFADDLPLMTWLMEHIWPAEQAHVDEAFVRAGSELAILEMLRGGITCFNDMYFFPEQTAEAAAKAGIRATVGMILIDFPTAYAANTEDYLAKGQALHSQWVDHPLIDTTMAPHAPYTVSEANLVRAAEIAENLNRRLHIHVHETADEVERHLTTHGDRPLMRLDALGLVNSNLLAVHMTQLSERERDRLAATGAHIIHCPEANMKLATGFCPIADLADRSVCLALGTDGAASNNDLDMLGEMRSAALIAKGFSGNAAALPAWQAIEMATLGGAKALGREHEMGSLKVGKAADFISLDLTQPESKPLHQVISQIVYATS